MSTDWNGVGVFTNVKAALESGYLYAPYEEIGGKTAADILKQVDEILQKLKQAYCRYHWQMTNESQEDRAYYDQRIRESRILSQLYANRATHHDRAKLLLREVETYQTRVLSASRNAQPPEVLVKFEDELTDSIDTGSKASTLESYTSWFSVFGRTGRSSSIDLEVKQAQSGPAPAYDAEGEGFIVSVTHFPKPSSEPIETEQVERAVPALRVEIIDPKLYALSENETYVAQNALQAMSELGQRLLNQSDSEIVGVSEMTGSPSQVPSFETTIQKFRKVSVVED
ncbi:hypothetical protein OPQ81_011121 [Rhizoctonia solani]|nr:hypothetical protein OPQ81_011121 [Rhizoctonia solani]